MKKLIALLCVFALLFVFTGCGLLKTVKKFVFKDEPEVITETEPEETEPTEATPAETEPTETVPEETTPVITDFTSFSGKWTYAGAPVPALTLEINGTTAEFDYVCVSESERIAEVTGKAEINDGTIIYYYDEDGWGNSGTLIIEFLAEDSIRVEVKDIERDEYAMWSLPAGEKTLIRVDGAETSTESGGEYDDLVGTYQAQDSSNGPLTIRYNGDVAEAEIVFSGNLGTMVFELGARQGNTFTGVYRILDSESNVTFTYDSANGLITAELDCWFGSDPDAHFEGTNIYIVA